jgi:hypothetical protein
MSLEVKSGKAQITPTWVRRRIAWMVFCLVWVVVPSLVFVARGLRFELAVWLGLVVGLLGLGWLFAASETLVPRRFLKWRSWMMEGGPRSLSQIGAAVDEVVGTGGNEAWNSIQAQRRVRIIGIIGLALLAPASGVLWLILHSRGIL